MLTKLVTCLLTRFLLHGDARSAAENSTWTTRMGSQMRSVETLPVSTS